MIRDCFPKNGQIFFYFVLFLILLQILIIKILYNEALLASEAHEDEADNNTKHEKMDSLFLVVIFQV